MATYSRSYERNTQYLALTELHVWSCGEKPFVDCVSEEHQYQLLIGIGLFVNNLQTCVSAGTKEELVTTPKRKKIKFQQLLSVKAKVLNMEHIFILSKFYK